MGNLESAHSQALGLPWDGQRVDVGNFKFSPGFVCLTKNNTKTSTKPRQSNQQTIIKALFLVTVWHDGEVVGELSNKISDKQFYHLPGELVKVGDGECTLKLMQTFRWKLWFSISPPSKVL